MIYISKLFSPISTGTSAGDIDVGATVKINENGQAVDYLVVHQGLPSDIYDTSCEGTWCLRKDIAESRGWNSERSNVLETSDIQAYLNGDWMNRYDPDVTEAIKQVKIPYCVGGGSSTVNSGGNGLLTKAFLLSGCEVGWTTSISSALPQDGVTLYYFQGSAQTDQRRISYFNGSAFQWWLRSALTNGIRNAWLVKTNGGPANDASVSNFNGIRPCIILPYSFKFQEVS